MPDRFPPDTLAILREQRVLDILTGDAAHPRRTTIWVVVDEADRVLVRSVRGPSGRWYRDLLAHPEGSLDVGAHPIAFTSIAADDPDRIAACNSALKAKYRPGGSLDSMLQAHTLPTTLELVPR